MRNNVTTVDEFKAFRPGTILLDNGGHPVWLDRVRGWCAANGTRGIPLQLLIADGAPFTVLYEPRPEKTGLASIPWTEEDSVTWDEAQP